jgi:hypothetical protein
MVIWIVSILGAAVLAVVGAVLGIIIAYIILALMGVTEFEGKRGLTAILFGGMIGAPLGGVLAFKLIWGWMS